MRIGVQRHRILLIGCFLIAIIAIAAIAVPLLVIEAKHDSALIDVRERLKILAEGRSDVLEEWLVGKARTADPVIEAEFIRLFATNMYSVGGDLSALPADATEDEMLAGPLSQQVPFVQRLLRDFADSSGFAAVRLMGPDGNSYASSTDAIAPTDRQRNLVGRAIGKGGTAISNIASHESTLYLDIAVPVFPPQMAAEEGEVVAALVLTARIGEELRERLAPAPLAAQGERAVLLQNGADGFESVELGATPALKPIAADGLNARAEQIPFDLRNALTGEGKAYLYGAPVANTSWWVVQELSEKTFNERLSFFENAAAALAALVLLAVAAAFGAFWWHYSSAANRALAEQYRRLATRIAEQKRLLDSINDTVADWIGLKTGEGLYRYVNPAFAKALGRSREQITGSDDAALFGAGTAQRLKASDRRAITLGRSVTTQEEVHVQGVQRHLLISKVPLKSEQNEISGIVSVARDITDLVEQQRQRERAMVQSVEALVRAIELRDPYLAGHSRRVAGFARLVAQRLELTQDEVTTVEMAANLSQVGKLAVSRDLLARPEKLTRAERAEIERHVDQAMLVLGEIDFGFPVAETIYEMHERMDGKGYPRGLSGSDIRMTARVLGVCDWFFARIEPRSYRPGIDPEEALGILRNNRKRYDPRVVNALAEVMHTVSGEKLVATVANM